MSNNDYPRLSKSLAYAEATFPHLLSERYSRILKRVELLWGSKEANDYFDSLILGDSEDRSSRQGFPGEILKEIIHLKHVHDFLFPALGFNLNDPFSGYRTLAPDRKIPEAAEGGTAPPSKAAEIAPALIQGTSNAQSSLTWPLIRSQREFIEITDHQPPGTKIYPLQGYPIEEILLEYGLLDARTLRVVRRMQQHDEHLGKSVTQVMVDEEIVRLDDMMRVRCVQTGTLMVDITNISIPFKTLRAIPHTTACENQVIPAAIYRDMLFLGVADPFEFKDHLYFANMTGYNIHPVFAPRHELVNRLNI